MYAGAAGHCQRAKTMTNPSPKRILIVDDNGAVHADFRKVLDPPADDPRLGATSDALFGPAGARPTVRQYDLDFASQGEEALGKVHQALQEGRPYALAFVDMRMPPGWDGLKTIEEFWKIDSALQIVICTAFSDHSWDDILQRLGHTDGEGVRDGNGAHVLPSRIGAVGDPYDQSDHDHHAADEKRISPFLGLLLYQESNDSDWNGRNRQVPKQLGVLFQLRVSPEGDSETVRDDLEPVAIEKHQDGYERSHVQRDVKGKTGVLPSEQPGRQSQVRGAADRQKFGDPLHERENNHL